MEQFVQTSALLESRAFLVGGLHFVIAAAVTAHTLMTKRDVPAVIGWIGMAWLAPVLGALLYVGIRRQSGETPRASAEEIGSKC